MFSREVHQTIYKIVSLFKQIQTFNRKRLVSTVKFMALGVYETGGGRENITNIKLTESRRDDFDGFSVGLVVDY